MKNMKPLALLCGLLNILCLMACSRTPQHASTLPPASGRSIQNGIDDLEDSARAVGGLIKSDGTLCTATLVCSNVIITAHHCVADYTAQDIRFTLRRGERNRPVSTSEDWYSATAQVQELESHIYQGLKAGNTDDWDGVSVLKTKNSVLLSKWDYPLINRILSSFTFDSQEVSIAGYGQNDSGYGSGIRRIGQMRFQTYESPDMAVQKPYGNPNPINRMLLRLLPTGNPETATCVGDSGGPIFDREDRLAGIVLNGGGACGSATNTVAFSIAYDQRWILAKMAEWCPRQK